MLPRVQKNVREWTLTFPRELPLWELESRWTPKSSKSNYRSQNPMDWGIPYIIRNLLEIKCLKWVRMTHLETSNTRYGQKKGQESNRQFDSRPLKVRNCPNFLVCKWLATYHWKALDKGYNLSLDLISIRGFHTKLWAPKVAKVPGQNVIWVLVPWPITKYTIRGKVVASPKSEPWWILWVWVCLWLVLAPKVLKLYTNQLVVWFVQVCVSN
jgi:hypothetical protein